MTLNAPPVTANLLAADTGTQTFTYDTPITYALGDILATDTDTGFTVEAFPGGGTGTVVPVAGTAGHPWNAGDHIAANSPGPTVPGVLPGTVIAT